MPSRLHAGCPSAGVEQCAGTVLGSASVQRLVRRRAGLHHEQRLAHRAGLDFLFGGGPHVGELQVHAQADAGQRVVAVEHDMLGVDLGDGVDRVRHAFGDSTFGQAFKLHARLDVAGEQRAGLEADEIGVVVAKGLVGLQCEGGLEADLLALQRRFDLGEQVIAAEQKLHRLGQLVDELALGIFESPAQGDDTGAGRLHALDFRMRPSAQCPHAR
mmetsp:Transcript_12761/g.20007  ORF Transcript_12761/g.20007 Transcript_12761/m.20007 type:complete len:215 (+) Transcript_12761:256-900(+)